jgi:hypothetical protein
LAESTSSLPEQSLPMVHPMVAHEQSFAVRLFKLDRTGYVWDFAQPCYAIHKISSFRILVGSTGPLKDSNLFFMAQHLATEMQLLAPAIDSENQIQHQKSVLM